MHWTAPQMFQELKSSANGMWTRREVVYWLFSQDIYITRHRAWKVPLSKPLSCCCIGEIKKFCCFATQLQVSAPFGKTYNKENASTILSISLWNLESHGKGKLCILVSFTSNCLPADLVAARSKACICSGLLAGIAGSNPGGAIDAPRLLWVLCVLSGKSLCDGSITRPEESYRM